jgi:glutathione transport system substrate-binding protein
VSDGLYPSDRLVAEALAGMLGEVGIAVQLEVLDPDEYSSTVWLSPRESAPARRRDFAQLSYGTGIPEETFRVTLASDRMPPVGLNVAFFEDAGIDARIGAALAAPRDQRQAQLEQLSREVYEAAPWIFSHFEGLSLAYSAGIEGLEPLPTGAIRFRGVRRTV